ncbi:type II toxin-antitoxin system MqsR family toxin [Eggerthella sinensis]|uniref:type II toxin-antitoxin system MqsR family toxin n=1 Tax=Eggerthella sinensis TaxID=242230 RepID=UPI001D08F9D3|nr:type II toxin-antitoxin system MqsR family toxin [Eggerthella sinensis]MCB7037609.1 type II toxin-antitoxin system MqsR family toxin [Eggerthella sinensis]
MMMKKNAPTYDLAIAKLLAGQGRYFETKKSTSWLRSHGFDPGKAKDMLLSLEAGEFAESLPPLKPGGSWADVYCCSYEDAELSGDFYLEFVLEEESAVLVLLSCKEWGYGW